MSTMQTVEPDYTMKRAQTVLKRFFGFLQQRLEYIHYSPEFCGKLVKVMKWRKGQMKPVTKRCFGDTTSQHGCYNCNYTGYDCAGGCGNMVVKGQPFCAPSCQSRHYSY